MADRTLLQTCEAEADNFELCGTTENGVLVQIWTAAITFLLQMYLQKCSKHPWNFSNLVKCIRLNLMTLKDLTEWLSRPDLCSYSDVNGLRTVATVYFGKIDLCLCWVALSEGPRPFGLLRLKGFYKRKRLQGGMWSRRTTEETCDEKLYTIACLLPHCVGTIMPQLRVGFQPLG